MTQNQAHQIDFGDTERLEILAFCILGKEFLLQTIQSSEIFFLNLRFQEHRFHWIGIQNRIHIHRHGRDPSR